MLTLLTTIGTLMSIIDRVPDTTERKQKEMYYIYLKQNSPLDSM